MTSALPRGEQLLTRPATINSTKKFRRLIPLPSPPDHGIVGSRRASGKSPHDLHQSTWRHPHLRSASRAVVVTVRMSPR
jgi:hypothetical protein